MQVADKDVELKHVDWRGRVMLPARWLRRLGLNYGDHVVMYLDEEIKAIYVTGAKPWLEPTSREK